MGAILAFVIGNCISQQCSRSRKVVITVQAQYFWLVQWPTWSSIVDRVLWGVRQIKTRE